MGPHVLRMRLGGRNDSKAATLAVSMVTLQLQRRIGSVWRAYAQAGQAAARPFGDAPSVSPERPAALIPVGVQWSDSLQRGER